MPDFKLHEAFSDSGAEEYKKKGNEAFQAQNWDEAIKNYNKAIQLDPKQPAFYSNRAACWSSKGNHESALADAKKCLETDPSFIKGYSRQGKALFDMRKLDEAETAYKEGLGKDPNNAGCQTGIADVQRAKQQARASARSSSPLGMGGSFLKKIMDSMKKGAIGGRMQMYAFVALAWFLYNTYTRSSSQTSSKTSGHDVEDDASSSSGSAGPAAKLARSFQEIDGHWLSYVEAGASRGDSLVIFLHRTSLSAEGEFRSAFMRLLEKSAASGPPQGGLRLLAPDRPCHGYSPCPANGKANSEWLDVLLSRPKAKKITVVASGRLAAGHAFAQLSKRTEAVHVLLLNPRAVAPSRGTLADPTLANTGELQKWLLQQQEAGVVTARAAADAARWAVTNSNAVDEAEDEKFAVASLPEGSSVTLLYSDGEGEDTDLQEELAQMGLGPKVRQANEGSDGLLDALVTEAWRLATDAEQEEEA